MLSEINQKERQTPYDITYMSSIKYGTNDLSIKQKRSWTWRTDMCLPRGERREGSGMDWESGVGRWKLLHLEWNGNTPLGCFAVQHKLAEHCKPIIIKIFKRI